MVEETTTVAVSLSEEQIQAQMTDAVQKSDWALVKKLAAELDKLAKAEVATKKAELQKKLEVLTDKAKKAFDALAQKLIDTGEYDGTDGIWYAKDFGDTSSGMKLMKAARKAAGEGGGVSKSSYVAGFPPNKEMLELVGDEVMFEEDTAVTIDKVEHAMPAGTTFKQAEGYSTNGGWRNRVRMQLGKAYTKATS